MEIEPRFVRRPPSTRLGEAILYSITGVSAAVASYLDEAASLTSGSPLLFENGENPVQTPDPERPDIGALGYNFK